MTVRYDEADDYPRMQVAISEQALDETLDSTLHPCFRCPNGIRTKPVQALVRLAAAYGLS